MTRDEQLRAAILPFASRTGYTVAEVVHAARRVVPDARLLEVNDTLFELIFELQPPPPELGAAWSLTSYIVERLHAFEDQCGQAICGLSEPELIAQRNKLRDIAGDTIGKHQAEAIVLRLLNAELVRRGGGLL